MNPFRLQARGARATYLIIPTILSCRDELLSLRRDNVVLFAGLLDVFVGVQDADPRSVSQMTRYHGKSGHVASIARSVLHLNEGNGRFTAYKGSGYPNTKAGLTDCVTAAVFAWAP